MYPRVSSYAAICGRSPVASIGQPIPALRALRDRKEATQPGDAPTPAENEEEYMARKQHESELLDEAIDESFPASDPASPFVPAIGAMHVEAGLHAQVAERPLKDQGDAIDAIE
jgi:hypothetical protein